MLPCRMKISPWPRYTTRIMQKRNVFSGRFWVKKLRHSENISDEKCYLYRNMGLQSSFSEQPPVSLMLLRAYFVIGLPNNRDIGQIAPANAFEVMFRMRY